jgi:hypothetical protein
MFDRIDPDAEIGGPDLSDSCSNSVSLIRVTVTIILADNVQVSGNVGGDYAVVGGCSGIVQFAPTEK